MTVKFSIIIDYEYYLIATPNVDEKLTICIYKHVIS